MLVVINLSLSLSLFLFLSQSLTDSTVYILSEVYKDRTAMARSLVRIFHALNKVSKSVPLLYRR